MLTRITEPAQIVTDMITIVQKETTIFTQVKKAPLIGGDKLTLSSFRLHMIACLP